MEANKKRYTLEELADHFETVATFGRIEGKHGGMNAAVASELRRLAELDAAIERGDLVWRDEG